MVEGVRAWINRHQKDVYIGLCFFAAAFTLYIVFAVVYMIAIDGINMMNVFFDADTLRVFGDMSIQDIDHYRTQVHPLFVIATQPFVFLLNLILHHHAAAAIFLQALVAASNVAIMYFVLRSLKLSLRSAVTPTIVFMLLFSQFIFSTTIETYIFAQCGLLLLWLVASILSRRGHQALNLSEYVVLALLGVAAIGITLTNFVQYVIVLLVVVLLNKKEQHKILKVGILIVVPLSIAVVIAQVQQIIWPSAPDFFTSNIQALIHNNSEEKLYISKDRFTTRLMRQIQTSTTHNLPLTVHKKGLDGLLLYWNNDWRIVKLLALALFAILLIINAHFVVSRYKTLISEHCIYLGLVLAYAFNFLFHMWYGNNAPFLYAPHYNFLLILTTVYAWHYGNLPLKLKQLFTKTGTKVALALAGVAQFAGIIYFTYDIVNTKGIATTQPILPTKLLAGIIAVLVLILYMMHVVKRSKKHLILVLLLIVTAVLGCLYHLGNTSRLRHQAALVNNPLVRHEVAELAAYNHEIADLLTQPKFTVHTFDKSDRRGADFFFFGMGNRRKMIYRHGTLYDALTREVIKQWDSQAELIIPSEYRVVLLDKQGKLIKITENSEGVFVRSGDSEEMLAGTQERLQLPDFQGKRYQRILKVLHQEILFHIHKGVPKPNIITYRYGGGWYRDGMLATMALEKTNNTLLLEPWVNSLTDIYDYQRAPDLKEIDNPGELLYILGAVKNSRKDLVDAILAEVKDKAKNGQLSGSCDGIYQTYYPTALMIHGAKRSNVTFPVKLTLPDTNDAYGKLTWWLDDRRFAAQSAEASKMYPYLDWASNHYSPGSASYILNETYPLTYELAETGSDRAESQRWYNTYYANKRTSVSHIWHASEMFLFLYDQ